MDAIQILEQLTAAAEQAGANIAPTYQEYMSLSFAIANSCGERGRPCFHRLCRLSEKYRQEEADKLFDRALKEGKGGNSLGTVFHLAELAGVKPEAKLSNFQTFRGSLAPPHTRTGAHTRLRRSLPPSPSFRIIPGPLSCSR